MRDQLPLRVDQDEKYGQTIARAMAKKFITINEVRLLFDCSRGYIDKLIEEAHAGETEHPIPYCDLNGLIVFEPEAVLVWARTPKQLKKKQKRQGPKKAPSRNIT
ncbi:MAG TPA: hypothetical protein VGO56_03680 [Pyrinomonadaceae bacterium]|nr:hypothetical protein [Pyrinomonadaceae bacterium]